MIWAGIVVYNPKLNRFKQNVDSVLNQMDGLVIFVNGCSKECELYIRSLSEPKIRVIWNEKNDGIATALNGIMKMAEKNSVEWVITLDQDSISPQGMVKTFKKRMGGNEIGIICPRIVDKRRVYMINQPNISEDSYVERCITSAACTRVEAWKMIGGFDDFLFIDLVDNDFCKRLRLSKWKILKVNSLILDQEYGDITPKAPNMVKFYSEVSKKITSTYLSKNIAKLSYRKKVSPLRVYYTNRNVIYLNKKFKNHGGIGYDTYCCKSYLGFMVTFNLASFVRGKNKFQIFKAIISGIKDGHKSRIKPLP